MERTPPPTPCPAPVSWARWLPSLLLQPPKRPHRWCVSLCILADVNHVWNAGFDC